MRSAPRDVLLGLAVAVAGVLPVFMLGALAVQIGRDLGFGPAGLGAATAAFFAVSALGSISLGRLGERLGGPLTMRLSASGSAICLLAVALVARSFWALLGVLVFGGLANALAQPAVNAFLAGRVPASRQGLVFGIKQSAIPAAVLLSGVSLSTVALTVGWRYAYAGAALVGLGAALAVPRGEVRPPPPVSSDLGGRRGPAVRPLAPLAAAAALGAFSGTALGAFLVTSSVAAGIGEGAAGALLAAGSAASLAVRVGAGWLADRRGSEGLVPTVGLLVAGTGGFVLIAFGSPVPLIVGAFVAFGAGWGWPGLFNFAVVTRHPEAPGTATGITQTGVYLGAGFGPFLFGQIAASFSLATAWAAAALGAALAAAIVGRARWIEGSGGGPPSAARAAAAAPTT